MFIRNFSRSIILSALALLILLPCQEVFAKPYVPQIVAAMGRQLDRQVLKWMNMDEGPVQGVSLFMTTPVNINDLEEANPLARQVQEDLTSWFVQAGYNVQEIRKGQDILFEPGNGEMLLTRRSDIIGQEFVGSGAILVGTYAVTSSNVRFNIKIMLTGSQDVIASSSFSLPINGEVASLLSTDGTGRVGAPIAPSVVTLLP